MSELSILNIPFYQVNPRVAVNNEWADQTKQYVKLYWMMSSLVFMDPEIQGDGHFKDASTGFHFIWLYFAGFETN